MSWVMALVHSLTVSTERPGPGLMGAMGAVSSMMQSHVSYPDRANIEVSTRFRKGTPGSGRLLSESSQGSQTPSSKRRNAADRAQGFGTRSNSHQDLIRDWTHNHLCVDAPPRLVPVSGQLGRVSSGSENNKIRGISQIKCNNKKSVYTHTHNENKSIEYKKYGKLVFFI